MYWMILLTVLIVTAGLAWGAIFLFRSVWTDTDSLTRRIAQNITMLVFSLAATLLVLEIFFAFFAQPDSINHTLASQNWFKRYWQVNSLGYRDVEWTPELLADRTKIMVVGDSLVAGHGISDPADRFPDLLGQMLGDDYAVLNVGQNGASTQMEIENALAYPYKPDIIILSFFINDILDTAGELGHTWQDNTGQPPPAWVDYSYALNFLYWRIYRLYLYRPEPQPANRQFRHAYDWFVSLYHRPDVWNVYHQELEAIHHYTTEKNIQLIVVVFPYLREVEESRSVTAQVADLYAEWGVPVVNVTEFIKDMPPNELIVNKFDAHPNEFVHQLVAMEIYRVISDVNQNSVEQLNP